MTELNSFDHLSEEMSRLSFSKPLLGEEVGVDVPIVEWENQVNLFRAQNDLMNFVDAVRKIIESVVGGEEAQASRRTWDNLGCSEKRKKTDW